MLDVKIGKRFPKQTITAAGSIPELMNDLAILLSGIHTQFQNADPATALMFRQGVQAMVRDTNGPCWQPANNQTGIIFQKPEGE